MAIIEFWKTNDNPITGFKKETMYGKITKKEIESKIDLTKFIPIKDALIKYNFKSGNFSKWCNIQDITKFIFYSNDLKRYYEISMIDEFLKSNHSLISKIKVAPKIPENHISLASVCEDLKLIYSTVYTRLIRTGVKFSKINKRIYFDKKDLEKLI